jgi:inactivated superfamily I helicase
LSVGSRELSPRLVDLSHQPAGGVQDAVGRLQDLVASVLDENDQLRRALDSRIVIEQAKGVLAERYGIDVQKAFEVLRASARNNRMSIHALAESVVSSPLTPPQIKPPEAA